MDREGEVEGVELLSSAQVHCPQLAAQATCHFGGFEPGAHVRSRYRVSWHAFRGEAERLPTQVGRQSSGAGRADASCVRAHLLEPLGRS